MPRAISSSKKKDRNGPIKRTSEVVLWDTRYNFCVSCDRSSGDRGLRGKEWSSRTHTPLAPRPFPSRAHPLTPLSPVVYLSSCARDPERRGFTLPGRQMSGCRSRATTIVWSFSGRAVSARVPSCCVSWKDPSASPTYRPSRILIDR